MGLQNLPKIHESEIPENLQGNLDTISLMRKVAHDRMGDPLLRKLAVNILNQYGTESHCFAQEAMAIGDYVRRKVRYVKDPTEIEYLQDPHDLVAQIQQGIARGDCDDMALMIVTLLLCIGHSPFFRTVRYQGSMGHYDHIYVVDYAKNIHEPEQRIVLDAIVKDQPIGFEVPHASGDEHGV